MAKRNLRGKLVLITGSGRGIGRATALELAKAGMRIAVADLDLEAAEGVVRELGQAGADARAYRLDVTDQKAFGALTERIEAEFGPVDVLINNAGIMTIGSFFEHGQKEDLQQIQVNLLGVAYGMRAVVPKMRARGHGHVVNIASMAGKVGTPHAAIYAATKHGVIGLTESVRGELYGSGVDFTYVMPSLVRTELIAGTGRPIWPPVVQPEQVAAAVHHALETGKLDVFVPSIGRLSQYMTTLLPVPFLDWIAKRLKVDTMFARTDERRAAYLERTVGRASSTDSEPKPQNDKPTRARAS
jgi:short-subunit dehydrogenase